MGGVEWGREKECFLNAYYMSDITLTLGINLGNNCSPHLLYDAGLCQILFPSLVLRNQMQQRLSPLENGLCPLKPAWPTALHDNVGEQGHPCLARAPMAEGTVPCPSKLPPLLGPQRLICDGEAL